MFYRIRRALLVGKIESEHITPSTGELHFLGFLGHRCKIAYERYHCQKEMSFDCHQMNRSHIIIILSGMHIFFHCNRYPLRPRNVLAGTEMHRLEPLFRCGNYHLILRYEIRIGTIVESNRLDFVPTQGNACNQKKLLVH